MAKYQLQNYSKTAKSQNFSRKKLPEILKKIPLKAGYFKYGFRE